MVCNPHQSVLIFGRCSWDAAALHQVLADGPRRIWAVAVACRGIYMTGTSDSTRWVRMRLQLRPDQRGNQLNTFSCVVF
jgi:hypothetical protein